MRISARAPEQIWLSQRYEQILAIIREFVTNCDHSVSGSGVPKANWLDLLHVSAEEIGDVQHAVEQLTEEIAEFSEGEWRDLEYSVAHPANV